jgi:3-methylcrotonyl-CoA carboxylase beta subunit
LPEQANVFPDRFDFGRVFFNQAKLSANEIPQIAVVMGSCTAGGAYVPAMCDETIIVKNQGTIFIGGPPLVKAATGEEITAEELGGGEVHTSISGVADHLAEDDVDALKICRKIVAGLPFAKKQDIEIKETEEPLFSSEEIYQYLSTDLKKPIELRAIIDRLTDAGDFQEFKANYGKNLLTGFSRIKGIPVGILGNQSFLTAESARKGAHFIQLCNQRRVPLLFLQNITGFVVGKKYEHEGIARDGAKLIHAVANSVVPKITVVIGGSFGAGNYAMAGRAFDPDFLFMWPHARIAVMGGQQASGVLQTIGRTAGGTSLVEQFDMESSAYFSSSRLWDDGIIDPAETRDILGLAFTVTLNQPPQGPKYGVFRM